MQKITCIYKITNCINGKVYIGQSINFNKRAKTHFSKLKKGNHHNEYLQKSYNKYGENAFKIEILQECEKANIDELEKYYIKKYNSLDRRYGYNIIDGGQQHRDYTEEQRKRISKALKGIKFTEEHKRKIGISNKGRVNSKKSLEKAYNTKIKNDTICSGDKNGNSVISNEIAKQIIIEAYKSDLVCIKDLANKYNTTYDVVRNLICNRSYKNICCELRNELSHKIKSQKNYKFTKAIQFAELGISKNEISKCLKISRNTIKKLMEVQNEKR